MSNRFNINNRRNSVRNFIKAYLEKDESIIDYEPLVRAIVEDDMFPYVIKEMNKHVSDIKNENYGCVYLISDSLGRKKIGITNVTPQSRLDTFQTGNAEQLKIDNVFWSFDYKAMERYLHQENSRLHIRGEWFWVDEPHIVYQLDKQQFNYYNENKNLEIISAYENKVKEYKKMLFNKNILDFELSRGETMSSTERFALYVESGER